MARQRLDRCGASGEPRVQAVRAVRRSAVRDHELYVLPLVHDRAEPREERRIDHGGNGVRVVQVEGEILVPGEEAHGHRHRADSHRPEQRRVERGRVFEHEDHPLAEPHLELAKTGRRLLDRALQRDFSSNGSFRFEDVAGTR